MGHMLHAMLLHKLPSLFPWKHSKTKMMAEPVLEEGVLAVEQLQPCKICGRTFLPAPLTKHVKICEKNATKKRKVFNSLRQRVEGTDLALFHQKTYLKKNPNQEPLTTSTSTPQPPPHQPTPAHAVAVAIQATGNKHEVAEGAGAGAAAASGDTSNNNSKPAWKERRNPAEPMRAATSGDPAKTTPSTTASGPGPTRTRSSATMVNSTFERCPCCDRQFGPKAYDRHVEWCREKMSRLPATNQNLNQEARERLEARTKYRVPPLNKNKRSVKEKYQLSANNTASSLTQMPGIPNVRSTSNADRRPNLQRSASVRRTTSTGTSGPNQDRCSDSARREQSTSSRSSEVGGKIRNPAPTKPMKCKPPPRVSALKINTVAVNEKNRTAIKVSNMRTPLSSESVQSVHTPSTSSSSQRLVTWKEVVAFSPNEQDCPSATFKIKLSHKKPKKQSASKQPLPVLTPKETPKEIKKVEPEIEQIEQIDETFVQREDSVVPTEIPSATANQPVDNTIDLDYVRSCLNSNNFQMMKLNDTQNLASSMVLIATRPPQESLVDDVFIVIQPPTTSSVSMNSPEKHPLDASEEEIPQSIFSCEITSRRSTSKIPVRPGSQMKLKLESSGTEINLNKSVHSINEQEIPETTENEIDIVEMPEVQEASPVKSVHLIDTIIESPVLVHNITGKCQDNQEDIEENYELAPFEADEPEQELQDDYIGIDFHLEVIKELPLPSVSDNEDEKPILIIEDNLDTKTQEIDLQDAKTTAEIESIATTVNEVLVIEKDQEEQPETKVDEGNTISDGVDLDETNKARLDRHPMLHSETDFQLRKAREMLNNVTFNNADLTNAKTRFEAFFVDSGMGDMGDNDESAPLKVAPGLPEIDAEQGDYLHKLEVVFESSTEVSDQLTEIPEEIHEESTKHDIAVDIKDIKDEDKTDDASESMSFDKLNLESVDHIIFERYGKLCDVESLHGIYFNNYSSILSKTRLERELRGCCSEVTLNYFNPDSAQMITASETDLLKFNHLQQMMKNHYEEQSPKSVHSQAPETSFFKNFKISQGTQPEISFDKNESVQTDGQHAPKVNFSSNVVEIIQADRINKHDIHEFDCTLVRPKRSNLTRTRSCVRQSDDEEDDTTLTESISPRSQGSPSKHHSHRKEKDKEKETIPFATRIYQNCLHHNIIKIKLRKILHNSQAYQKFNPCDKLQVAKAKHLKHINRKLSPTIKRTDMACGPVEEPKLAKTTYTCDLYHGDTELTDSECSTMSKTSPRFRTLVDVILNEKRSEVFRLSRKDCRRLIKLNPKKLTQNASRSSSSFNSFNSLKLPKITMVMPLKVDPKEKIGMFKSTIETLPRIVENPPTSTRESNSIQNNTNNASKNQHNTAPPAVYNPFVTAERQLMELLDCDDFKPYNNKPKTNNTNNKTISPTSKLKPITPTIVAVKPITKTLTKKRESVIDPPYSFKDINSIIALDDPRDDIDFEMLENFINDNFNDDELMRKLDLDTISLASCSTKTDNNASFYDDISIDPRLINDFDNLSIPDHLDTDTTTTPDMRQYPITHSNRFRLEPLDHQKRPRKTSTSSVSSFADLNMSMSSHRDMNTEKRSLSSLKRTVSIPDPVIKPAKNLRNREDVERYFNETACGVDKAEKERRDDPVVSTVSNLGETGLTEELFSVDDEMYEEYKKYEQMYLMEREEQIKRDAEMHSQEEAASHMISGDSAYGSLNRSGKTKVRSKVTKLSPMEPTRVDSASSSGSDTCVMQNAPTHPTPLNAAALTSNTNTNTTNNNTNNSKLSKFCHECGNRYPLSTAKFCVECGVRRLPENDFILSEDDEDNYNENEDL